MEWSLIRSQIWSAQAPRQIKPAGIITLDTNISDSFDGTSIKHRKRQECWNGHRSGRVLKGKGTLMSCLLEPHCPAISLQAFFLKKCYCLQPCKGTHQAIAAFTWGKRHTIKWVVCRTCFPLIYNDLNLLKSNYTKLVCDTNRKIFS